MNTRICTLLSVACLLTTSVTGLAQGTNFTHPEQMVASVDSLVSLSAEQRTRVTEIVNRTMAALGALSPDDRMKDFTIHRKMRTDIMGVLTPEQRKTYERTPQTNGGGLTLARPESKLERLNQLVSLTAEQKNQAAKIFNAEFEALIALSDEDRAMGGMTARKTAREATRAILNSEQQAIYDSTPQGKGGGSTKAAARKREGL